MSTLVAQTISNGTVSTSSANVIQGSAKAWVNFNGTGTVAIRASYNVSSITDNGTGQYTVNFTNAFADTNYTPILASTDDATASTFVNIINAWTTNTTTSSFRLITNTTSGGGADRTYVGVAVFR
jgi:hypothetical protein